MWRSNEMANNGNNGRQYNNGDIRQYLYRPGVKAILIEMIIIKRG